MKKLLFILAILSIAVPALAVEPIDFSKPLAMIVSGRPAPGGAASAGAALVTNSIASSTANSTAISRAFGTSTSTGHLLIVVLSSANEDLPETISDDRENTWTRDEVIADGNYSIAIFSAIAKDNGTVTVTATRDPTNVYWSIALAAFSGIANNTPDDTATASVSSTDVHAGDLTTSAAGVIIGGCDVAYNITATPDENWTGSIGTSSTTYYSYSANYRITSASGTYNDGWTGSSANWWKAATVAYK